MEYTSLAALTGNSIDYAGTFPPAALTPFEALKEAATFRREGKCPWLLGRVSMKIENIKKLDPRALYEAGADGAPWIFTAIGAVAEDSDPEQFERSIEWELRELRHLMDRYTDGSCRMLVTGFETKLPQKLLASRNPDTLFEYIAPVLDGFADLTRAHLDPCFELVLDAKWQTSLLTLAEALGRWCEDDPDVRVVPGIKLRAGGDAVPTTEQLAEVIVACTSRGLRFKATQGLHHAVAVEGGHGFVNVLSALAFAQVLGVEAFGVEAVKKCLDDRAAASFQFGAKALSWSGKQVTVEQIEIARRRHGATFGSCSLKEPEESLLAMIGGKAG